MANVRVLRGVLDRLVLLAAVLLAACIEPPKHEEFAPSSLPDAGLAYWNSGYPPMYFRGPFLTFFRQAPEHALTFLIKLRRYLER